MNCNPLPKRSVIPGSNAKENPQKPVFHIYKKSEKTKSLLYLEKHKRNKSTMTYIMDCTGHIMQGDKK
jgi:hypothetical protein